MQLAADAAPLWRICDVHLKPGGGVGPTYLYAGSNHEASVAAACKSEELSKGEKLQTWASGGMQIKMIYNNMYRYLFVRLLSKGLHANAI
jgi:hypothetical protein